MTTAISPSIPSISSAARADHEAWLLELTGTPTAAGCEHRVVAWIAAWASRRAKRIRMREDEHGNVLLESTAPRDGAAPPLLITAHLDHPAFVVRDVLDARRLELEFRGGVADAYFENARIEVIGADNRSRVARIEALDAAARPFKRVVAAVTGGTTNFRRGDIARWRLPKPRIAGRAGRRLLHTHACDDLAAVAAALAAFDTVAGKKGFGHVGLLFTLAEEVGFAGAIAAARDGSLPADARLVCLENSRSFPESPIGAGPILRVGDRLSVFSPALTNRLGAIYLERQKADPSFRFQRKLMPGGACEATAFAAYGHQSTCLCLPLGNYHNMTEIDAVAAGQRPALVGPEFIAVEDFHGLVQMLLATAALLDSAAVPPPTDRFEALYVEQRSLLGSKRA